MAIRKKLSITVCPTMKGRAESNGHVVYSHDINSAQFILQFIDESGKPLDLIDATPTALLVMHEESGDRSVVLDEFEIVSLVDGEVAFIIPSKVMGYTGKCDMYIYLDFADGSSSDEVHVSFTIERSLIDDAYVEAGDYYIREFEVILDEVEEEAAAILSRFKDLETEVEQSVRLYEMYLDSLDFEGVSEEQLLQPPYNMRRQLPNKNIANPDVTFPIQTSEYKVYEYDMQEAFVIGETYTITVKATKPNSQTFMLYNDAVNAYYGNIKAVEGETDLWSLTFTPHYISNTIPSCVRIFQYPPGTVGNCTIDWVKIEKGPERTPFYPQTYKGVGIFDSNDPTKYSWDYHGKFIMMRLETLAQATYATQTLPLLQEGED